MNIHNWIMDISNSIMDMNDWTMDIHNCKPIVNIPCKYEYPQSIMYIHD